MCRAYIEMKIVKYRLEVGRQKLIWNYSWFNKTNLCRFRIGQKVNLVQKFPSVIVLDEELQDDVAIDNCSSRG